MPCGIAAEIGLTHHHVFAGAGVNKEAQSMAKGDHIKVKKYFVRANYPLRVREGDYWHHGIDCGDDTVIHFVGGKYGTIRRTSMVRFLGRRRARTVYHRHSYPADEVVKRAESRLGQRGYNLIFNNCEHFTRWCKTGDRRSKQVDNAAFSVGTTAAVTATTAATAAGVSAGIVPVVAVGIVPTVVVGSATYGLANRRGIARRIKKVGRGVSRLGRKVRRIL